MEQTNQELREVEVAHAHGFPTLRALLIQWYKLDGRTTGWIAVRLNYARTTISRLLKREGIPAHGQKLFVMSEPEVKIWKRELEKEYSKSDAISEPGQPTVLNASVVSMPSTFFPEPPMTGLQLATSPGCPDNTSDK